MQRSVEAKRSWSKGGILSGIGVTVVDLLERPLHWAEWIREHIVWPYGDYETVKDLWALGHWAMHWLSGWLGPFVTVASVLWYWRLSRSHQAAPAVSAAGVVTPLSVDMNLDYCTHYVEQRELKTVVRFTIANDEPKPFTLERVTAGLYTRGNSEPKATSWFVVRKVSDGRYSGEATRWDLTLHFHEVGGPIVIAPHTRTTEIHVSATMGAINAVTDSDVVRIECSFLGGLVKTVDLPLTHAHTGEKIGYRNGVPIRL